MKKDFKIKADAYFAKGVAARDAGHFKLAKKWFVRAAGLVDKKRQVDCWALAADCDEEQGKLSDALQLWRKAEICCPTSAMIQRFIGRLHLEMGRPKLAQRVLQKSICIKPTAIGYIFLASAFRRQGRFGQQKACYQSALQLEPNNDEAHYNLGTCYELNGQYSKAEKHFRRAIEIDPKYGIAYAELGFVLAKTRGYDESYRMLRRAVKLDPDYYWARMYFAMVNWKLHRLKEAEKQYREALRIAPDDSLACASLGYFLSSEQRGNGEKYLKRAIVLDPTNAVALYYMATHLHWENRESQAISYLKKAARRGHERAKEIWDEIKKRSVKFRK
jgi:tetratricopeptide (TPR) repeat protein